MDVESRLRGAELPDVSVDTEAALSRTANRGRTARRRRVGLICTCAVLPDFRRIGAHEGVGFRV